MLAESIRFLPDAITAADPSLNALILVQPLTVSKADQAVLSAEELEKASRFARDEDRLSFINRRATLRKLLAHWLQRSPAEKLYEQEQFGKPVAPQAHFHFNVSRTSGYNVYYFGPCRGGIDVECIEPTRRFAELERTQLHADEKTRVNTDLDFFTVWTRKEAVLKADGSGITDDLWKLNTAHEVSDYNGHEYPLSSFTTGNLVISLATEQPMVSPPLFFLG
ncbi:MAG: 4'-phosphopantetheinyl transferase superfamily protein [Bacteroidia bacterium]